MEEKRKYNLELKSEAMSDRLAHHGYILLFKGASYRMKHTLMRQKDV